MKNQHFWHKKPDFTLFHDFSASQPSWSVKDEQITTLQLRRNSGKQISCSRTPKHTQLPKLGCFWAFSHFFCFWGPFFENFEPHIYFFIHQTHCPRGVPWCTRRYTVLWLSWTVCKCGIKYPEWLIYATSIHKTELSNLTKNEIVLRPKHGAPLPYNLSCNENYCCLAKFDTLKTLSCWITKVSSEQPAFWYFSKWKDVLRVKHSGLSLSA